MENATAQSGAAVQAGARARGRALGSARCARNTGREGPVLVTASRRQLLRNPRYRCAVRFRQLLIASVASGTRPARQSSEWVQNRGWHRTYPTSRGVLPARTARPSCSSSRQDLAAIGSASMTPAGSTRALPVEAGPVRRGPGEMATRPTPGSPRAMESTEPRHSRPRMRSAGPM
jgi:hypothetical protein